jgi:hypothetical protein
MSFASTGRSTSSTIRKEGDMFENTRAFSGFAVGELAQRGVRFERYPGME